MGSGTNNRPRTYVFWNADSWLPDKYEDSYFIDQSLTQSLVNKSFRGLSITAYGDGKRFTDAEMMAYYESNCFTIFKTSEGSDRERVFMMLLDIIVYASGDERRKSHLVVITKLSQDSEMICRVLASLIHRNCNVLFTLPELVSEEAQSNFEITVRYSEDTLTNPFGRIAVWFCPTLFDCEQPHHPEQDHYFIEPPAPDSLSLNFFSVPYHVQTCVLWDVQDYPLPPDLNLSTFYRNITRVVSDYIRAKSGHVPYGTDMAVFPYVVEEDKFAYEDACEVITTVISNAPKDKFERLARIAMDSFLWSMDNPSELYHPLHYRPNLLVISKLLQPDILDVKTYLLILMARGYNVFLAVPCEEIPPSFDFKCNNLPLLSWERLTATGKRKRSKFSRLD